MARITRTPGDISRSMVGNTRVRDMKWIPLRYANRSSQGSLDTTTWTDAIASNIIQVVNAGGTDSDLPGNSGNIVYWNLKNSDTRFDIDKPGAVYVAIEVTSAPTLTYNMYVVAGITYVAAGSMPDDQSSYVGLHYDASPGPDVRAGVGSVASDTAGQSGVDRMFGTLTIAPGRRLIQAEANGCNSSEVIQATKRVSGIKTVTAADSALRVFVACGRTTDHASEATIQFKVHVAFTNTSTEFFPTL